MSAARVLDISVRFRRSLVFLGEGKIEVRELNGGRRGALLHRYALREVECVELFVGGVRPRKVLRLTSSEAIDLGGSTTMASGLRDARDVSKLVDRPVVIREEDYLKVYFADHAPLLYALEPSTDFGTAATPHLFHQAYDAAGEVGPEDPTIPGSPAIEELLVRVGQPGE
ncbi:MAG: hypothetical protein RMA76_34820 [Deltaproteobacteria bacterium]